MEEGETGGLGDLCYLVFTLWFASARDRESNGI